MNRNVLILMAAVLSPAAVVASPNLDSYELVFSDEFNDLTVDTNKWGSTHLWGPYRDINQEQQYYVDALDTDSSHAYNPFILNGSTLSIQAVPTTASLSAPAQPDQSDAMWASHPEFHYNEDYDPQTREYLSGILTSVDEFNFTHGYTEARIRLPEGQGLWSAFWLLTSKYVENAPEIDIMEALGHTPNTVHHTMHYFDISNNWQSISTPTYDTIGTDFTTEFHVYGVAWSPTKITWYVDGEPVRTVTDDDYEISTQSMYVLLNVAVGGSWPGDADASTQFPASMEVDYVRVYQLTPPAAVTPSILANEYQLMFEDEFNGNALDASKWNTSYLWGPYYPINAEHQVYIDKNGRHASNPIQPFEVASGVLTITAETLGSDDVPAQPDINDVEWSDYQSHQYNADYGVSGGWIPSYSSGLITSYDSFKFVNGYVEARIKLPDGGGLWPAFWLLNGYYVGAQPEIDIMELDGAYPNSAHQSYHYFNDNGVLQSSATQSPSSTGSFADDFHVYAVQWDANQIKWYVDGAVVRTLEGPEVSTQLMYILINLAVGGNFVGAIDDAGIPAQMQIDYVRAYQRRDHIFYCNGELATIVGTDGADNIVGTSSRDVIVAMSGDDSVDGAGGDDLICGGYGDDTLFGSAGDDFIYAGPGDDQVKGGPDNDTIYGGLGADFIRGSLGDDYLVGDAGSDLIDGGWGDDFVKGGPDDDDLIGNLGNDTILGSLGNDSLNGGEGDDVLNGGWGDDYIKGGPDNDKLQGSLGDDTLLGSLGDDLLYGDEGDDVLNGGWGDDYIKGGPDNDELQGSLGDDTLLGSRGDDLLDGGLGNDILNAGVHDAGDTCVVDSSDTTPAEGCE